MRRWPAVLFALCFPTAMAWLYFVVFAADADAQPNRLMQLLYAAGKVVQFGFPLLWLLGDRAALRDLSLKPRGVGLGLAFGVVVALGFFAVFELLLRSGMLDGLAGRLRAKVAQLGLASPGGFLLLAGFLALLHSGMEEWYWRGFVHGQLSHLLPQRSAIAVSSLGFMAHHVVILAVYLPGRFWTVVVPLSLCIAVGGAFWAWLHVRSRSLLGPWISHALVDAALMAAGYRVLFA
ncbi:MAG: CPBP family intramembrane metalloprotease [Gemmataceae bacterium]|nr:CPBP family intramembrane metalloprotease [Gemmataceae bacterium]